MRAWIIAMATLGLGGIACSFDASGVGSTTNATPKEEDSGTGAAASSDEGGTTVDGGSSEGDVAPSSTDSRGGWSSSDGSGSGSGDLDSSTGAAVDPCAGAAPVTIALDVSEARVVPPMELGAIPSEGMYAYSETTEGAVVFDFELECPGEFRAYAYVHDPAVGLDASLRDPDSFFAAFDDDEPAVWRYGCQTFDEAVSGSVWAWEPIVAYGPVCFDNDDFRGALAPGPHRLRLSSRESGVHSVAGDDIGNVAAVAAIVVTNDPTYSP